MAFVLQLSDASRVAPAPPAPLTASPSGRSERLCRYRGKACDNERSFRLDGTPHQLCNLHRARANLNQRRSQQRQRRKKQEQRMRQQAHTAAAAAAATDGSFQVAWASAGPPIAPQAFEVLPDELLFRALLDGDVGMPSEAMADTFPTEEELGLTPLPTNETTEGLAMYQQAIQDLDAIENLWDLLDL